MSAKDAQLILGHAHVTTTLQIYQHGGSDGMRTTLSKFEDTLAAERVDVKTDVRVISGNDKGVVSDAAIIGTSGTIRTYDPLFRRQML